MCKGNEIMPERWMPNDAHDSTTHNNQETDKLSLYPWLDIQRKCGRYAYWDALWPCKRRVSCHSQHG